MGWQLTAVFNLVIGVAYTLISLTIGRGLIRTGQVRTNPLAVATAAIFTSCAVHHAHHAVHLLLPVGSTPAETAAVRAVFSEWHSWLLDGVGALVALTYLGLRRSYDTLLHTPAMFEDAVRVAAEQQLRALAYSDALTGCGNRAALVRLDREDGKVRRTVAYLDLDGFKGVNDRYGHEVGDRLLAEVGRNLREGLPGALVFRLGGDEFAVVVRGDDDALLDRCRELVALPVQLREGTLRASSSVGVASGRGPVEHLLREADMQMYREKRGRRDGESSVDGAAVARARRLSPVPRREGEPLGTAVRQDEDRTG